MFLTPIGYLKASTAGGGQSAASYAANSFTPTVVADFAGNEGSEFYLDAAANDTFDDMFTYDETTGLSTMLDSDGALKWGPHNLFPNDSEDLSSPGFTATNSSITAAADTYDGISLSSVEATGTSANVSEGFTLPRGGTYKAEIVIKDVDIGHVGFGPFGLDSDERRVFSLSDGSVTLEQGTPSGSASSTDLGGGYFLLTVEFTTTTDLGGTFYLYLAGGATDITSNAGDIGESCVAGGIRIYRSDLGGMVNNPDRGDSYVPTTSAARYLARRNSYLYNGTSYVNQGLFIESEARTNLFLNSTSPATQGITVTAAAHTVSFYGTGSITLSGAATGTLNGTGANDLVSLTVTPSAGTLTCTVAGTITNPQVELGSTPSSRIPTAGSTVTRAAQTLSIAAANMDHDATAMSFQMSGATTYEDNGANPEFYYFRWQADGNNKIQLLNITSGGNTGIAQATSEESNVSDFANAPAQYLPGLNIPFNLALRVTTSQLQLAKDGSGGSVNSTLTAIPDVSANIVELAPDFNNSYMGHISQFLQWSDDIGDTGIEEASA